jgi:hypothetical protein
MKVVFFFLISALSGGVMANDVTEMIKGNFEGGKGVQYFKYDPNNIFSGVDYFSSSVGGVRHYDVIISGECEIMQFYKSNVSKNTVVLDGSCEGQGSQVHQYIYKWDSKSKNWCLRQEIVGERADRVSGLGEQLSTQHVTGCLPLGVGEDFK